MPASVEKQGASKEHHGKRSARLRRPRVLSAPSAARLILAGLTLGACVSALACGRGSSDDSATIANRDTPEPLGVAQSALSYTCSGGERWIAAAIPAEKCPHSGSWIADPIVTKTVAGITVTHCTYAWPSGSKPLAADVSQLASDVAPGTLVEDCMIVGSLAEPAKKVEPGLDASAVVEVPSTPEAAEIVTPPEELSAGEIVTKPEEPQASATIEKAQTTQPVIEADKRYDPSVELLGQKLRQVLRERFGERAGAVSLPVSQDEEPQNNPVPIRVTVLDSEPDSDDPTTAHPGRLRHGAVMSGIIRDLTCPGWPAAKGSCVSSMATKLALPLLDVGRADPIHGGEFGTLGQLARAVTAAVNDWKTAASADPSESGAPRLVLNLSIGAQPGNDCAADPRDPGAPRPSVVLYDALRFAACHGAVVVAAAGNDPGGGAYKPGATCPGAWANLPAPTASECIALFDIDYGESPFTDYPPFTDQESPLLYAAHGVDAADEPVTNARDGARSWIVGPGLLGVSSDTTTWLPEPLTGSSVAAAAVSGIAAAVWAYRPELSGRQVMEIVHASGVYVGDANLCPPELSGKCDAHRASLCSALTAACAGSARCPAIPACASSAPLFSQNAQLGATVEAQLGDLGVTLPKTTLTSSPNTTTPTQQFPTIGVGPWTNPQPTIPPCGPACTLALQSGILLFTINPAYPSTSIGAVTLRLDDGSRLSPTYQLMGRFTPGTIHAFSLSGYQATQVRTATLSFQIDGALSTSEQIAVH